MPHDFIALWLVTAGVALFVGIWLGIAAGWSDYIWGSALFGWVVFLAGIWQLLTGKFDFLSRRHWLIWLLSQVYPLSLLFYGLCAAWMLCLSGQRLASLLLVGVATAISALVTIPVSWMKLNVERVDSSWRFHHIELSDLLLQGFILINLSVSAALGWCLSLWLASHL